MIKHLLNLTSPQPIRRHVETVYSRRLVCAECSGYLHGGTTKETSEAACRWNQSLDLRSLLAFHIPFIPDGAKVVLVCQCAATLDAPAQLLTLPVVCLQVQPDGNRRIWC